MGYENTKISVYVESPHNFYIFSESVETSFSIPCKVKSEGMCMVI